MIRRLDLLAAALALGSLTMLTACENKAPAPAPSKPTGAAADKHDDHAGHDHAADGDKHDHDHDHDEGPATDLGSATIGAFHVQASRLGAFKPGDDTPVELRLTVPNATSANLPKAAAVRAWFGTQDAKGSVKAKMELEKDHYHSHVEIPSPLPAGSKLWIEIEDLTGAKTSGSFDIKNS